MKKINGLSGAPGTALGRCVILKPEEYSIERRSIDNADNEIEKLESAREQYRAELDGLYEKSREEIGEDSAKIFLAYKEMVNDDIFFQKPVRRVREEMINIEYVIEEEKKAAAELFHAMDDPYMKDRGDDIENVCNALVKKMLGSGSGREEAENIREDFIIAAEDLSPADTVRLDKTFLKGIATVKGGQTSHTVILAKTLGIPAVVGAAGLMEAAQPDRPVYIDGTKGEIVIEPDPDIRDLYEKQRESDAEQRRLFAEAAKQAAETPDGHAIKICINAGAVADTETADLEFCDGIGLFRTEFLYMAESDYPTEEKQFEIYRKLAENARGKEVVIRTLDIGGDKKVDYMGLPKEDNPFLGYRAIRICLDRQKVFRTQLRAILRASAYGRLSIMFPMIVNLEELRTARRITYECMKELRDEGIDFDASVRTGIMIETPAAVLLSDKLAAEADFFSIGTNDLIQYITAADRMNEQVQYLYNICSLSVMRAIKIVADNARKAGIPVGICGESASDEKMLPVWLYLGIDKLSMVPAMIGRIKYRIRHITTREAWEIAGQAFEYDTAGQVEDYLRKQC